MEEEQPGRVQTVCRNFFQFHWRGLLVVLIPMFVALIFLIDTSKERRCLFVIFLMGLYWATEVIPIWVTGLLPVILLPCLGILDSETTCKQYLREPIAYLFLGCTIVLCFEFSNFHQRAALKLLNIFGCKPRLLHFVIMFLTMFTSMWISNALAACMMCAVVRALLAELEAQGTVKATIDEADEPFNEKGEPYPTPIARAFYLGVAYAASIGGCGTLLGSPTNYFVRKIYEDLYSGNDYTMDFARFMGWNIFPMLIITVLVYLSLQFTNMGLFRINSKEAEELNQPAKPNIKEALSTKYNELGPITLHQIQVLILFILLLSLFLFRKPDMFPGYADGLDEKLILNTTPIVLIVLLLFMLPINYSCFQHCFGNGPFPEKEIPSLIAWGFVHKNFPWGLLFLLGGGFALAEGCRASKLQEFLTDSVTNMQSISHVLIQLLGIISCIFVTNFVTDTPVAMVAVPVFSKISYEYKIQPIYFVMPTGVACSHAFLWPAGTPSNVIAKIKGNIKTKNMIRAGIVPSVISIIMIFINAQTWHFVIYSGSLTVE